MVQYTFKSALPVWEAGKDKEMNYHLAFRTVVDKSESAKIALTASSMYQMFIDGKLVSEGPARAGHGYYRVDEIDISKYLTNEKNIVCIYVAGSYVENYYLIKQPSFLCAEIIADGKVVAATGRYGFEAWLNISRIRKVCRYSFQRTFIEAYNCDETFRCFEKGVVLSEPVKLETVGEKKFIERGVALARYDECDADVIITRGRAAFSEVCEKPFRIGYAVPSADTRAFEDAEVYVFDEINKGTYSHYSAETESAESVEIPSYEYVIYKMPTEKSGFIRYEITAEDDAEIIILFDETLDKGDVTPERLNSHQRGVVWYFKKGTYSVITNEPYTVNYLKLINKSEGKITVKKLGITEFAADIEYTPLNCGNENLDLIHKAAIETYKQNAIDIFTDCPSRERAGWLCDSFFTARVEKLLTGKSDVERNFLENFLIAEDVGHIDSRMFPMCFPSDHINGNFIPNWAMWYVVELEEYLERSGDRELVDMAKDKILSLCEYFEEFENSDGLLENLEKWIFVDWSKANDYVDGVNYPSNMMYAWMLEVVTNLYGDKKYAEKAAKIKEKICEQSYFDGFFRDHAVRDEDGNLKLIPEHVTESCQYYAFFTKTATKYTHPELWKTLVEEFGPGRMEKGLHTDVAPSNAFMGLYIRLDLLSEEGDRDTVLSNIEGFFIHMAKTTGTLWEDKDGAASCNHGFASHVLVWMDKFIC